MKKSPDLTQIESSFSNIKRSPKGHHRNDLDVIKRVISRRYDLQVNINIVENDGMQFFGMSIYPESDVIDKMVDSLVEGTDRLEVMEDIWAKNKRWVIDIDSLLLYDITLNANPAEITAILLHEIGHTIHSNAIPNRVGRVIKYTKMSLGISVKKILKWSKARKILGLTFIEACGNKNFHNYNSLHKETEADKIVVKEGYGEDLNSFLSKLLSKKGNGLIERSEKELEQEVESVLAWSVENIAQLELRKNILDRNLKSQMMANKSPFVRNYLLQIRELFFGKTEDRVESLIREQNVMKEYAKYSIVTESFKDWFSKNGKLQKVTNNDIDIILIESNRIENENDRIYVLDLIYSKLDIIELSLDLLSNKDTAQRVQVSKDTLLRQKEELLTIRKQIMSLHLKPKDFNVLVNYPVGYEG